MRDPGRHGRGLRRFRDRLRRPGVLIATCALIAAALVPLAIGAAPASATAAVGCTTRLYGAETSPDPDTCAITSEPVAGGAGTYTISITHVLSGPPCASLPAPTVGCVVSEGAGQGTGDANQLVCPFYTGPASGMYFNWIDSSQLTAAFTCTVTLHFDGLNPGAETFTDNSYEPINGPGSPDHAAVAYAGTEFSVQQTTATPPLAGLNYHPTGSVANQWVFDGSPSIATSPGSRITAYAWDFGDGTTGSTTAPSTTITHTFAAEGDRTVTLTVTDSNGSTGTTSTTLAPTLTVTQLANDPPVLEANGTFTESISVRNDGTTTVTGVTPSATVTAGTAVTLGAAPAPPSADIPPGLSQTFAFDGTTADAGSAAVTASATGTAAGARVTAADHRATVTVIAPTTSETCVAGSAAADPLTCTTTIVDASGGAPHVPTGAVTLSANSGTLATPSCTLIPLSATASSCAVTYTPVPAVYQLPTPPQISASYPGDGASPGDSASQTLTCSSGLIVQLNAITSDAPHPNGYTPHSVVTLAGCGLSTSVKVYFGTSDIPADLSAAGADATGTHLQMYIPETALTGAVSFTRGALTATLADPNPFPIDSVRNTSGLKFDNIVGYQLTTQELVAAFPGSDLHQSGDSTLFQPWVQRKFQILRSAAVGGLCLGFAVTSGEFATGALSASTFDESASVAHDLNDSAALDAQLATAWMSYQSDQFLPSLLETSENTSSASITSDLMAAMGTPNGSVASSPAIMTFFANTPDGWEGHSELAYSWYDSSSADNPGQITIETADSNVPFSSAEGADATGNAHGMALNQSWLTVNGDGSWNAPWEGMSGDVRHIAVTPLSDLTAEPLTVDQYTGSTRASAAISIKDGNRVEAVTSAAVGPESLDDDSADLLVMPEVSTVPTEPPPGAGEGGIAELVTQGGASTVQLNGGGGDLSELWEGQSGYAMLDSSSDGHVAATFDPATGLFTLAPIAGEAAPASTTGTVIAKVGTGSDEREVSVTSPLGGAVATGFSPDGNSIQISSATGGTYDVTVSATGGDGSQQPLDLGGLAIGAGQTLTIALSDWATLSGASEALTQTSTSSAPPTTAPAATAPASPAPPVAPTPSAPTPSAPTPSGTAPSGTTAQRTGALASTGEPGDPALLALGLIGLVTGGAAMALARRRTRRD